MQASNDLHNQIASALTGVVKQIKAIRYYPPRHPALAAAAEECLRGFQPLLASGNHLQLTIRKEGFLFDDSLVAKGNQVLSQLAMFCFARRIQYLTILSDLAARDLNHFVHYLNLDHQEIQRHGGVQHLLEKARVTTIWTNEQDLDAILERKAELEQQPEQPDLDPMTVLAEATAEQQPPAPEPTDLLKLLKRLEQEKDDSRFRHGLQELIPLLRLNLKEDNRKLVLKAMLLLCRNASSEKVSEARREYAVHALGQLVNEEMTDFLVDYLLDDQTDTKTRQALTNIIGFMRGRVVKRLMERLAEEKQAPRRKLLAELLIRCGPEAVPILLEHLYDDRWYVVRNAIAILGEIRSQEALVQLTPLLEHDDLRVRRETIRTLTKIGGQRAIAILLQAAEKGDQELRRQALLSLGAIRAAGAVPTLRKLLRQSGWSQNIIDLKKDAIRALGEIRSTDAIPDLLAVAQKRRLFNRALNEELRIAALNALGEIGDAGLVRNLDRLTNDKSAPVARAAAKALKQTEKANS